MNARHYTQSLWINRGRPADFQQGRWPNSKWFGPQLSWPGRIDVVTCPTILLSAHFHSLSLSSVSTRDTNTKINLRLSGNSKISNWYVMALQLVIGAYSVRKELAHYKYYITWNIWSNHKYVLSESYNGAWICFIGIRLSLEPTRHGRPSSVLRDGNLSTMTVQYRHSLSNNRCQPSLW